MVLNPASVSMILGLISEAIGVASELAALARRMQAGEEITDADVQEARAAMEQSVDRWHDAAEHDKE